MANFFSILAYTPESRFIMTLPQAIQSVDIPELFDRMTTYAYSKLRSVGLKDFNGQQPEDFVGELILKVMDDQRKWSNAKCSFTEFLFGSLRSEISNFLKTQKREGFHFTENFPENGEEQNNSDLIELRNNFIELLQSNGANDDEIKLFEYWADGVVKPQEIADDWPKNIKQVYVIIRRLERRRDKVSEEAKKIYEQGNK